MKRLFVGNIPFDSDNDDLAYHFKEAGHPVTEARIMTDRDTGNSRGFGFVTLSDDADLNRVIGDMNQSRMGKRVLTVNEARPLEPRTKAARY